LKRIPRIKGLVAGLVAGLTGGLVLAWAMIILAQPLDPPIDDPRAPPPEADEDDGFLLRFINDLLSGPGREVRIRDVSGVLSSQATIGEISVADADGVWLAVRNVTIDWSRRALFLRRLSINELTIGAIEVLRPPLPAGPRVEAEPFTLPELPLEVLVDTAARGAAALGRAGAWPGGPPGSRGLAHADRRVPRQQPEYHAPRRPGR
jgi:hypothetical protein